MVSIAELMLAKGCAPLTAALHGEAVEVLSGLDAGLKFSAVIENESDIDLSGDSGPDPRVKRIARFSTIRPPRLRGQDIIQTGDGKKWKAVKQPGVAFLTVDFELVEISPSDT